MLGIGESGNFPAAIKATTEWFPTEERALATGIFNSGSNASSFIAPRSRRLRHLPLRLEGRLRHHRLDGLNLAGRLAPLPI